MWSWSILQHFAHVFMAVFAGTCRFRKYFVVRLTNYLLIDFGAAKTSASACQPYQSSPAVTGATYGQELSPCKCKQAHVPDSI
eukprot:jgi/Chrzof1/4378/Cz14g10280.t1